jgi:hypothetical protein
MVIDDCNQEAVEWRNISLSYTGFRTTLEVFALPGKSYLIHVLIAIVLDRHSILDRARCRIEYNLLRDN